jgi:hypothetical protein
MALRFAETAGAALFWKTRRCAGTELSMEMTFGIRRRWHWHGHRSARRDAHLSSGSNPGRLKLITAPVAWARPGPRLCIATASNPAAASSTRQRALQRTSVLGDYFMITASVRQHAHWARSVQHRRPPAQQHRRTSPQVSHAPTYWPDHAVPSVLVPPPRLPGPRFAGSSS